MRVCVLPGDGIGPEVTAVAVDVLKALPVSFSFEHGEIGYGAYEKAGAPLPKETLEKVEAADATLLGAVTTPPNLPGYRSPVVELRRRFDLFVNLRPIKSMPHPMSREGVNMILVRENTEGLYAGRERVEGDTAITERVITRRGSERILRYAFERARDGGFRTVTVVHKANVLRETCGLFRSVALDVAEDYPQVAMKEMLVDACAMNLICDPSSFEVIVTTNLFGDILGDEAAMLVGGLGLACSANIGTEVAVFEPVHGSAPDIAGAGTANPLASILSGRLMLEHLGLVAEAKKVENAVARTLKDNAVTPDLGGSLTTRQVGDAVIQHMRNEP
jgi:homoisocitrate dehydrogenase